MSAASTYYSFIQKPTPAVPNVGGGGGASPQNVHHHHHLQDDHHSMGIVRRRQTAASPSCSSIATSSSNSSSSLNGFGATTGNHHQNQFLPNSSMVSPISLASPCSSSVSSSSSSSSSASSSASTSSSSSNISRKRDLLRQSSLTPTQGVEMNRQLFHSCTLHSLEPKPFKPYKSSSEYLEAMKEDLAEWLNRLYSDLDLTPDNLFQHLETGAILCRHANNVTQMGRSSLLEEQTASLSSSGNGSDIDGSNGSRCQQQATTNGSVVGGGDNNQETFNNTTTNGRVVDDSINEPNNNNIISSRSPSISFSSPNDSLQYQSYCNSSIKSPLNSLNGSGNSLMMINQHSSRHTQDYGISYSGSGSSSNNNHHHHHNKTINWFQIKMIPYKQDALPGTFLARDNICQFILWCRSLNILECLLFETDDLVARKNEKSFILCMLEVARIGFKVGMPTPLIIQLEQEIDREIENDAKRQKQLEEEEQEEQAKLNQANEATAAATINNNSCLVAAAADDDDDDDEREDCDSDELNELDNQVYKHDEGVEAAAAPATIVLDEAKIEEKQHVEDERRDQNEKEEEEVEEEEELDFGPKPQVITNDLLSLHEKVVQLLCLCTCPTQFPMVRVGDNGKYKVGDKLIIFVRILRRHIMVRVGGGWQELSEFLRVKDPCRAKSPPHNLQTFSHQHQQQHYNTNHHQQQNHHHQNQSQLARLVPSSRSRLGESSHHLNKGHHHKQQQQHNNQHHHQSYRNNSGIQRLISGSASMSWLSHNS